MFARLTDSQSLWELFSSFFNLTLAAFIGAISIVVFLVPAQVSPQGASGLAVILNELIGLPVGILILILNIPIIYLGYRMLPGGLGLVIRTIYVVVVYSIAIDLVTPFVPEGGFSDDRLLNTIFGGIIGGISGGMVYRTGANFGGTSTIALILQRRIGAPLSTTFLYTDTLIIVAAGLVFGLEGGLYAMVSMFLGSLASDYIMEGPSVIRTAVIITNEAETVGQAIMKNLGRGATLIPAWGMYSGEARNMLYVTISRAQVRDLRQIVSDIDETAFIVIGQGQTAYGEGFLPLRAKQTIQKVPDAMLSGVPSDER